MESHSLRPLSPAPDSALSRIEFQLQPRESAISLLRALAALGGVATIAGAFLAPGRAWPGILLAAFFLAGLGLAGIFFVALQYASGASWCVSFRRVSEAMASALPYGAAALAAVFLLRPSLYPWTTEPAHDAFKHVWLSRPFFLARAAVYLAVWIFLAFEIIRNSRRQDQDGDIAHTRSNIRLSVAFLLAFALTFWLASYDWIMSLEPHWYSTIFGVYNFAGLFTGGLSMLILLALWLRRGPLRDFVSPEHLHDLGKLLFAFSTFWMYIWFSQYMLIWYANIPEETVYYIKRLQGFWQPLFLLNMLLNWGVPFLVLLPRATKRNPGILAKVAIVVLLGRILDLYLMIVPPSAGRTPLFGLWELAPATCAVALFLLIFMRAMRQAPPVPIRDPYLAESLHYHN